jgi:hypothetical protein
MGPTAPGKECSTLSPYAVRIAFTNFGPGAVTVPETVLAPRIISVELATAIGPLSKAVPLPEPPVLQASIVLAKSMPVYSSMRRSTNAADASNEAVTVLAPATDATMFFA